jgi:hypothetical protein
MAPCLLLSWAAPASIIGSWDSDFNNGGVIPDGKVTGWSDTREFSGLSGTITHLSVTLELSGGWNGDYYAALSHAGQICILLNRVGVTEADPFGYADGGLKITLDDTAVNGNIHLYQALGASYAALTANGSAFQPDGRFESPLTVTDSTSSTKLLSQFNGLNAAGPWTLFIADVSDGNQGTVRSWGLNLEGPIVSVPEPRGWATMAVTLLMACAAVGGDRWCRRPRN